MEISAYLILPHILPPQNDPMSDSGPKLKVLIVCLGNICRSPMGEAVLAHIASERGLDRSQILVDSAGTGSWHVGEDPDDRTVATCKKYKVPINHAARQVTRTDFSEFTHILAADTNNLRDLERIRPANSKAELRLWGSYAGGEPIPDPYYGGNSGFETCYQMCTKLSNAFLDAVL